LDELVMGLGAPTVVTSIRAMAFSA
jgi:hypothetical protein